MSWGHAATVAEVREVNRTLRILEERLSAIETKLAAADLHPGRGDPLSALERRVDALEDEVLRGPPWQEPD